MFGIEEELYLSSSMIFKVKDHVHSMSYNVTMVDASIYATSVTVSTSVGMDRMK